MEKWTNALQIGDLQKELQAAVSGQIISNLSSWAVLTVSGEESGKFLQGQLTNDVRQVNEHRGQLSAWCNPKGQVIADFLLWQREKTFYLLLPKSLAERVLKRLSMFVLRARTQLSNVSETMLHVGVAGEKSPLLLENCLGLSPPAEKYGCVTANQVTVMRLAGKSRFVVFADAQTMPGLWARLAAESVPSGQAIWELTEILSGIPWISDATSEKFIPQMLNLPDLEGVSFKKGCYPGQEVVARSQYLGEVKRRLFLARIALYERIPQAGDNLYAADTEQVVGQIINAQPHPDGAWRVLAVAQTAAVDQVDVCFYQPGGARLNFLPLP